MLAEAPGGDGRLGDRARCATTACRSSSSRSDERGGLAGRAGRAEGGCTIVERRGLSWTSPGAGESHGATTEIDTRPRSTRAHGQARARAAGGVRVLRTGRASASLLDPVMVEAYGATMPINQLGTVTVPEPRMVTVNVWDKAPGRAVEKAIRNAGLGHQPG